MQSGRGGGGGSGSGSRMKRREMGRGGHKRDINGFVINEKPSDETGRERERAAKMDDDDEMLRNKRSCL